MDERARILEMVRDGKLSVEEADKLLRALESDREGAPVGRGRLLRVRITSHRGDNVNVALPLSLADVVLRLVPKGLRVDVNGEEIDVAKLVADVRDSGARGTIVDMRSVKGDHIQILVE
jgi:hypothetical protein